MREEGKSGACGSFAVLHPHTQHFNYLFCLIITLKDLKGGVVVRRLRVSP